MFVKTQIPAPEVLILYPLLVLLQYVAFTLWVPQSGYSRYEWDPGKLLLPVLARGDSWFISAGAIRGHERPKSNQDLLIGIIGSSISLLLGKLPHWQESTSLLSYTRQEPWLPESVSPAHSPPHFALVNHRKTKLICNLKPSYLA